MYVRSEIQWALVYPTTSVPHEVCQINQMLDEPGYIVHRVVMLIHSGVPDK